MRAIGPVPLRTRAHMDPGNTLGRYTIEGVLGEGGMGVVYRARDARLGRKVALKVLAASDLDPEAAERTKRFVREARLAAALDHPNAVSIYDVGETGDLSFIAMELVHGRSLRSYVGEREPGVATRLRWLVDIAAALAAAHRARLIHRDVKPENVMIRDDGRVKVLDFGLARRAAAPPPVDSLSDAIPESTYTETGQTTLTAVGTLLGTPQYMAPEQIRSDPLDARADQFSWGIVAYEVLTGQLPWGGAGLHVMARILTDDPKPIHELNPDVPEEAVAVIMRALSRAADDRFPTMEDAGAALEPYAEAPARTDGRSMRPRSMTPQGVTAISSEKPPPSINRTQRSAAPDDDGAPPALRPRPAAPPDPSADPPEPARRPSPRVEVVGPPEEPFRPRGLAFAAGTIALCLGGIIGWRAFQHRPAPPPPIATSTSAGVSAAVPPDAAPAATAVTDLPEPRSASPDAVAAYRLGLSELRFGGTRDALERASALDPSLAVAHLQCAVEAAEYDLDEGGRAHLRKAVELRAQLGERDQMLLDALDPVLLRQPADWAEGGRRLAVASARFPGDAQLWYERGLFAQTAEGPGASAPYAARAVELDPRYAQAMSLAAQDLAYLGRFAEARKVLARCIEVAPTHVTCATELSHVLEHEGACEEEETMARQLVTASPAQGVAEGLLAAALAARGRPDAAVREALKLKWAALPEAARRRAEPEDTLALDLLAGDFVSAERTAKAIEAAAEPSRREVEHGRAARILAQIYTETGRVLDAARVAGDYLGRRDAWEPDARSDDYAMAADAVPDLLAAARKANRITPAELILKRAEWVRGWEKKAPLWYRRYVWAHGFAATVDTADDAREALVALPEYEPLPIYYPRALAEAQVGRALLLGGRTDEALPWLERAARTCRVLELPVQHTRAALWLGMAREARGDKEGACAAYRVVRDRWGKAKPRSVTAEKAADRQRALGCAP
jgi:eukaryotic-like serine/threonine-protein kinase